MQQFGKHDTDCIANHVVSACIFLLTTTVHSVHVSVWDGDMKGGGGAVDVFLVVLLIAVLAKKGFSYIPKEVHVMQHVCMCITGMWHHDGIKILIAKAWFKNEYDSKMFSMSGQVC